MEVGRDGGRQGHGEHQQIISQHIAAQLPLAGIFSAVPQVANQKQDAEHLRGQGELQGQRGLQAAHALQRVLYALPVAVAAQHEQQHRGNWRVPVVKQLPEQTVGRDDKHSALHAAEKEDEGIGGDAEQPVNDQEQAVHGLRVNTGGKNLPLGQTVEPGVVDILVTENIAGGLKGPPGQVEQKVQADAPQQQVLHKVGPDGPPHLPQFCPQGPQAPVDQQLTGADAHQVKKGGGVHLHPVQPPQHQRQRQAVKQGPDRPAVQDMQQPQPQHRRIDQHSLHGDTEREPVDGGFLPQVLLEDHVGPGERNEQIAQQHQDIPPVQPADAAGRPAAMRPA